MNDLTGILYIVATPIGNLQDITQRALETFSQVDLIAGKTRAIVVYCSVIMVSKSLFSPCMITMNKKKRMFWLKS